VSFPPDRRIVAAIVSAIVARSFLSDDTSRQTIADTIAVTISYQAECRTPLGGTGYLRAEEFRSQRPAISV
jgi:hypothetical protein